MRRTFLKLTVRLVLTAAAFGPALGMIATIPTAWGDSDPVQAEPATQAPPVTQPAAVTQPLPLTQPTTEPTTAPATLPSPDEPGEPKTTTLPTKPLAILATPPHEASPAEEAPEPASEVLEPGTDIIFQFDGIPTADVIRRFAQMAGKPFLGNLSKVGGEITFFDSAPYTYEEALDTLNLILEMQGPPARLIQKGRYLRLVELSQIDETARIIRGEAEIDEARPGEIVTVVIPLQRLNANEVIKAVTPILSKKYGKITQMGRGKGIIVTETVENIRRMRKLLAQMESEPVAEQQFKSVRLKHASANSVAQIVTRLFGTRTPSRAPARKTKGKAAPRPAVPAPVIPGRLVVTADQRSNTIFLLGPADKIAMAERLIEQLDVPKGITRGEMRVFKLENANARDLTRTIENVIAPSRRGARDPEAAPFRVAADDATNTLIVSGPVDEMDEAEKLIRQLDEGTSITAGAKIIPLKSADANQLAPVILNASSKPPPRGRRRGRPQASITVTAEPQTNSLIIVGPEADMQRAVALINELDRERDKATREIHVIQLKSGDVRQIARSLTSIFVSRAAGRRARRSPGSIVRVEPEPGTNSLIISAPPSDWEEIKEILDELQAAADSAVTQVTRLVPLEHAEPEALARTLNQIYARGRRRGRDGSTVTIAPSTTNNSLLILASEIEHQAIAELIKSLDVPPSEKVEPVVMIRLESAGATATASKLRGMIPRVRGRDPQEVFIQADEESNSVLIRGPEAQRKVLEDAIAKLDQATQAQASEMVTVKLKNTSAREMATMISQMYRSRSAPRTRGRRPAIPGAGEDVTATAAPDDKTLIIEAPKSKIGEIIGLIAGIDSEGESAKTQIRTYQMTRSDAGRLARTLANLWTQRRGPRGRRTPTAGPRFDADTSTNQLIVAATTEDFEEIEKLISNLQGAATLAAETRVYELKFAKADEIVSLLRSMIGEDRRRRRSGSDAPPVRIASVPGSNSVVVQAAPENLALGEQLIGQFDTEDASGKVTIEIVRLANAQADSLVRSLQGMLPAARRGGRSRQPAGATITAEPNSNSVLIRGPVDEVASVVTMIKELDAESESGAAKVRVYPLKNSDAVELAQSLSRLFRDITRGQGRSRRGGAGALFNVEPDERFNRLVVTTTDAYFALVEELLETLDAESDRPANEVRYFWLRNANSSDVAMRVSMLFESKPKTERPVIEADLFDNTLTVIAKSGDMKEIESLVSELDEPDRIVTVRVIPIIGASAEAMAETLKRVYGQMTESQIFVTDRLPEKSGEGASLPAPDVDSQGPQTQTAPATDVAPSSGVVSDEGMFEPEGELPPVTIAVDKQSNSLIISATQKEFDNIRDLIGQLTAAKAAEGEDEIHIVPVKQADPAMVAQILNDLFNPRPVAQPRPQRQEQQRDRRQRERAPAPGPVPKQRAVIIPDSRTRRLIIRAKRTDFEMMRPLIEQLDKVAEVVSELRVFELKNSDATEVARNLREIFSISSTAPSRTPQQRGRRRQTPQQQRAEAVRQMIEIRGADGMTKVDTSTMVTITANRQSNSIVVAAPAESMDLISKLISELDQSAAGTAAPVVRLYPVKYADVSTLVTSLQATFALPQRRGAQRGTREDTPVIITGDEAGGLVIVSATLEKHKLISQVLTDLDNAQSQDAPTVKVFRIKYADPRSLADAINTTMTSQGAGARRRRGAPQGGAGLRISSTTNSIVVRATAPEHQKIAKLIEEMDVPETAGGEVRLIPLKNADPTNVANILNRIFGGEGRARRRGRQGGASQQISIEPDNESRMLVVRADDETFASIRELAAKLDVVSTTGLAQTILEVQHSDASALAAALSQAFPAPRRRGIAQDQLVTIVAEPVSNSLIVNANQENLKRVKDLLSKLDTPAGGGIRTEMIILKNARASELADVLSQVARTPAAGRRGRGRQAPQQGVVVVLADSASNALILSGPSRDLDKLMEMAVKLDEAAGTAIPLVKLYPIKNAEVQTMVDSLQQIFSPVGAARRGGRRARPVEQPIVIVGDEMRRLVMVSAPAEKHPLIEKTIREIDESEDAAKPVVKVYKIQHADANSVAQALNNALGAAGSRGRGRGRGADAGTIGISADRSSNSVIVRAPLGDHEGIAALIEEMDVPPGGEYPVRSIPLNNADPDSVAKMLNNVFGGVAGGRGRGGAQRRAIVIEPSPAGRLLMVRCDDETFEKIRTLGLQIDAADETSRATRTLIPLKYAQATGVAAALTQAFTPGRGQRGAVSPDETVTVVAEPTSNTLIVGANAENLAKIHELLAAIDSEEAGGMRTELLVLSHANASEVAKTLTSVAPRPTRGGRGAQQEGVKVSAEPGSNALVFSGPSAEVDKMLKMAVEIDLAAEQSQASVRIIQLTNGDATEVAAMMQDLQRQQQRAKRGTEPLAISADVRANAVILTGSKTAVEQGAQWITEVEKLTPQVGPMRIIELKHADPEEVKKAIDQLFQGGSPRGFSARPSRSSAGAGNRAARTGGKGGKVETSVMPKQRAILVSASDADFEAIKALVEALDKAAEEVKQQVQVFMVVHASNTRIATALNDMYRRAARPNVPEDRVSIAALPQTNAVVVTAVQEKMDEIGKLIAQLDTPEVTPDLEFRVYPLENVSPGKILPALRNMIGQIQKTRPEDPINVEADERTRSVIVSAKAKVFDQVEKIVKKLDEAPIHRAAEVLIIPLKKADARSLATVLNEMLRPSAEAVVTPEARALQEQIKLLRVRTAMGEEIPDLDLTKPIKIQADPAQTQGSNSLMITSTPDNLKAMQAIVEIMDTVPIGEGVKVRLIHLKNADAPSVMTVLREIFAQGQQLSGRKGTSVAGKAVPESVTGKALVHQFNVSADVRTNTLVISGVEESIALAELVIKDLDRESGKIITEVQVFRLKHASSERLVPILQAVFAEGTPVPEAEGVRAHVTRLRTIIKPKHTATSVLAKSRATLTIQPDKVTNSLVVAARSDIMPLIADVISTMDIPGTGSLSTVRIFPLQNADAARVQKVLTDLYSGPNANLIDARDRPTIAIDTRTNSLVVSTSESTFELIGSLLKSIDAVRPLELTDVQIIPLANAEATALADTLQKMMEARVERLAALDELDAAAMRVLILADARSNALIVGGSRENFLFVKSLAEKLDGAAPALAGQVQLIPLKKANAGNLSQSLSNLFDKRYEAARTPEMTRQKPIILPDLRTNALLVVANADDTKILKSLLTKLDVEILDPAVRLVVIPIVHNDAGVIAPMIENLFEARLQSMTPQGLTPAPQDRVDVAFDALSNALVVSASKENIKLITGLLDKVDIEPPERTGLVRMYPLVNSDAQRIATMLEGLFAKGIYKPGLAAAGASPILQAREKVAIAFDARTNVLIVSASKENFAVIDELIKALDATEDFGGDVRMYQLKHADATEVAPTLQRFFDAKRQAEQQTGATGRSLPVSVIPDARTNTLLVTGSRESFKAIDAMIERLDAVESPPATDFRIFYLKNATAATQQPILEKLLDERIVREDKDAITVIADPNANALIVGASPDDIKVVESLIPSLDTTAAAEPATNIRVFNLVKADAQQVVDTIETLYEAKGGAAESGVNLSVDERTNAIVARCGPEDMQRIAEMIDRLDGETITQINEVRVFKLEYADAEELAKVLTDTLTTRPESLTGGSENRANILQFTQMQGGKQLVASALQEGVLVTAVTRTNSLLVSAPSQFMPLLADLIDALDLTSPRIAVIRVFPLVNADARRMADVLSGMFRMEQADTADVRSIKYVLVTDRRPGEAEVSATMGTDRQNALSITVDVRTNSLLVGGTQDYVDLCRKIIEELDASPAQERVSKVYRLRNARAGDIETALKAFLEQEYQYVSSRLGGDGMGAAQRLLEREVAVVAVASEGDVENANTLLISASPRYFETVMGIIKELDQPAPQVLIQVLLVEVSLNDTLDFGIDWSILGSPGNNTLGVGTDLGIEAEIGKFGGFSVVFSGSDFNFFLRALQSQTRIEVLSRPQILASDNQVAEINVGERVPFITNSRVTDEGSVFNTITYEDVGILLTVTPRINPDGFVRMEVAPEISSVSESTVEVSEGVSAIIVNSRKAETTATVQDGHTIVIGGLIRTDNTTVENKVPLLGDIPVLGWLFKEIRDVEDRKELLIVLTPHIINNVRDADSVTAEQIESLSFLKRERERDPITKSTVEWLKGVKGRLPDSETRPAPKSRPGGDVDIDIDSLPDADVNVDGDSLPGGDSLRERSTPLLLDLLPDREKVIFTNPNRNR